MGSVVALDLFRVSKVIGVKWSTGLHESAVNSSGSIGVSNLDDNVACAFCPVSRIVLWGQGGVYNNDSTCHLCLYFQPIVVQRKGVGRKKNVYSTYCFCMGRKGRLFATTHHVSCVHMLNAALCREEAANVKEHLNMSVFSIC